MLSKHLVDREFERFELNAIIIQIALFTKFSSNDWIVCSDHFIDFLD